MAFSPGSVFDRRLSALFAGPVSEDLDFRKRFALSSYHATLKRSGVTPPWLPTNGRDCQSRRADMLRRSAIALT
jgi:hypothetical protein